MKTGLFAVNMIPTVGPAELAKIGRLAEDLGYESLWAGEHPLLPDPAGPFDPRMPLVDPVTVLSFLSAITTRIKLATGILLLPLRNPVILAKQIASLDVLSAGRVILGIGMGYIEEEALAVGVPFADRAARGREYLEAMRSLWNDPKPNYQGKYVNFRNVDAHPRPVQRDVRVVIGGHTPLALRRTITHAHGWYGFGLTPHAAARFMDALRDEAAVTGRPETLGPLEITVTPPRGWLARDTFEQYVEVGVNRLVLYPPDGIKLGQLEEYVKTHAEYAARAGVTATA
jgi:probable F420-dependent oxidoreductase